MTWLPVDVSAARERDAVLALQPEAAEWWLSVLEQSWQIADPDLLELCSSALAQLLDCRAELERDEGDALDILDSGRESRASEEAARAFVAYAEQFAVDQNGLAGDIEDDVLLHLSRAELCNFVQALNAHDGYLRVMSLLDVSSGGVSPLRRPTRVARRPELISAEPEKTDPLNLLEASTDPDFYRLRAGFGAATARLSGVDDLTTEVCRLRNANHQACAY